MTSEVVVKLEHAFAIDATVTEACSYADISCDAFYAWLKKNPEFRDRMEQLRDRPILAARQTIVKAAGSTPQYALEYLKRKRRKEFGDSHDVTSGGKPINISFDDAFAPETEGDSEK